MIKNPSIKPDFIPALSLWAPWSALMALEEKRNETRDWATTYRGPIVIHSSQRFMPNERLISADQPFKEVFLATILRDVDWAAEGGMTAAAYDRVIRERMICGALVCIVNIVDCGPTVSKFAARHRYGDYETAFGNYSPGRFVIRTEFVRAFDEPIPYSGHQGWFNVPKELVGCE